MEITRIRAWSASEDTFDPAAIQCALGNMPIATARAIRGEPIQEFIRVPRKRYFLFGEEVYKNTPVNRTRARLDLVYAQPVTFENARLDLERIETATGLCFLRAKRTGDRLIDGGRGTPRMHAQFSGTRIFFDWCDLDYSIGRSGDDLPSKPADQTIAEIQTCGLLTAPARKALEQLHADIYEPKEIEGKSEYETSRGGRSNDPLLCITKSWKGFPEEEIAAFARTYMSIELAHRVTETYLSSAPDRHGWGYTFPTIGIRSFFCLGKADEHYWHCIDIGRYMDNSDPWII